MANMPDPYFARSASVVPANSSVYENARYAISTQKVTNAVSDAA